MLRPRGAPRRGRTELGAAAARPDLPRTGRRSCAVRILGGGRRPDATRDRSTPSTPSPGDALVVVFEDLHWSDGSTLDLLDALAMRPTIRPGCSSSGPTVPGDGRAGQPAPSTPSPSGLRLRDRADVITLDALAIGDVAELTGRLGRRGRQRPQSALHPRAHGRVPAVRRAPRSIPGWRPDGFRSPPARFHRRHLAAGPTEPTAIPDSVRQLIEHAFDRLADHRPVRSLSAAAAVAGRRVHLGGGGRRHPATLRTTSRRSLSELARRGAFMQRRRGATWPDGTVTSLFAFDHDLHREVLYRP